MAQNQRALVELGLALASLLEAGPIDSLVPGERVVATLYVPVTPRLQEAVGSLAFHPSLPYQGSPQALVRHAIAAWCYALIQSIQTTDDDDLRELKLSQQWDLTMARLARRRQREDTYVDYLNTVGAVLRRLCVTERQGEVRQLVAEAMTVAMSGPVSVTDTLQQRCADDPAIQHAISWLERRGDHKALEFHSWIEARVGYVFNANREDRDG